MKLSNADRSRYAELLAEMKLHSIPESRLLHVYHYQRGDDVELACELYLECLSEGDASEVACQ